MALHPEILKKLTKGSATDAWGVTPGGAGGLVPPPNRPPPVFGVPGVPLGAVGVLPPVAGTAEGSSRKTSSS